LIQGQLSHPAYVAPLVEIASKIGLQNQDIHSTVRLELTGNLSKSCWIDVVLDNSLEFWLGSIWQLEALRVWKVREMRRTWWRLGLKLFLTGIFSV
jgi:hypothetical protein